MRILVGFLSDPSTYGSQLLLLWAMIIVGFFILRKIKATPK